MKSRVLTIIVFFFGFISGLPSSCPADEGMWLFNNLPKKQLKEKYGFEPTKEWAEHVMKACVRFNVGGSASFVSSRGLVMTNHHVASDTLFKLSSKENNYAKNGFLAASQGHEIKAPDLELNQLVNIADVTQRVNAAVKKEMTSGEAARARRAVIATIESEATAKSGLRCDVVTLYGGGKYHLYQYKVFTDVRLVWAPEAAAAFFGGDADNFEYPRYCLDVTLFRVYENGKPAKTPYFFKWSDQGAAENELTFVAGNPGRTSRIYTHAALKYQRDHRLPFVLNFIRRREILLQQFGLESDESKRRAQDELFGIQNARKAYLGKIQGLQDPGNMAAKLRAETALITKVKSEPQLADLADAWQTIESIQQKRVLSMHRGISLRTKLFTIAQQIVQLADENEKPNEQRLPPYQESARASLEQKLYSPAPIYKDLERVLIGDLIGRMVELRGGNDPLCQKILGGMSPSDRAAAIIDSTRLDQVDYRKQLVQQGKALSNSNDGMIRLARIVDAEVRKSQMEAEELSELEQQAYAKISKALFATQGTSTYPDATFTLRLAYGPVKGYQENGKTIPAMTHFSGAFSHEQSHGAKGDYKLPGTYHAAKAKIDGSTPVNFVNTTDIIGGNSGSPVINKNKEIVGLIFDGNIQSLTGDYFYSEKQARSVSVHSNFIRDAMKFIYGASRIADELGK
ncbi:MAG: S46 family peptidase [Planctomycetota bacterium]|nr:S46 family peptidase [Planctomycetota bacterium]